MALFGAPVMHPPSPLFRRPVDPGRGTSAFGSPGPNSLPGFPVHGPGGSPVGTITQFGLGGTVPQGGFHAPPSSPILPEGGGGNPINNLIEGRYGPGSRLQRVAQDYGQGHPGIDSIVTGGADPIARLREILNRSPFGIDRIHEPGVGRHHGDVGRHHGTLPVAGGGPVNGANGAVDAYGDNHAMLNALNGAGGGVQLPETQSPLQRLLLAFASPGGGGRPQNAL